MASAANSSSSSSSSISPRHMSENHGNPTVASAQSRRQVSSPWTQIVRPESELPIAAAPSSPQPKAPINPVASLSVAPPASLPAVEAVARDENAAKKPVWKRPSNEASEIGTVMGASSWPALSEATKAPSNKSSSDSLKSLGDVPSSSSVPVSQGIANASFPATKQFSRPYPNPTPSHSRQRSFKRNGASGSVASGIVSQASVEGSSAEFPSHNPSPRGQNQKNGFASQAHIGTDNQRDSYRNQNGNHYQSHGGRRNQEHGNQNWAFHKSFNGRDGNAQSQRGTPSFIRHAPPPVQPIPQFMPAQPFGSHVPFPPELASQYYPRMPFITPLAPAPVFYHLQDLPLNIKLQKQIHYYFSEENLITDTYLRGHMDDQGFVPLRVIAGFKKITELTNNIQQIVEALQGSPFVEVQGDRIRKRYHWQHWLLPKMTSPAVSSPQSINAVASQVGNLSLSQSSPDPISGSSRQLQPAKPENKSESSGVVDPVSNRNDTNGSNR